MLDKLSQKIITVLNEISDNSSTYKIFSLSDIITKLGKKYKVDAVNMIKNLEYLAERDYIDIKYIDEKDVCLALLSKARIHDEEVKQVKKEKLAYMKLAVISSICSAVSAFLGGFLAFLIMK